jgi:AAA ATPase-like protein
MSGAVHEHLNLRGWPFQAVPSEETATIWVGRPETRRRLRALLRTIERVDASRIVLMWAAYGAGKTHALLHLKGEAREREGIRTLYVVAPRAIRNFVDVYRAIIDAAMATDVLADLGVQLYRRKGPSPPTDLQRALVRIVSLPEAQHRSALSWLKAEKLPAKELRESALTRRLETSADAVETLNELMSLLQEELNVKLVILLDEIQELGQLTGSRLEEVVGGLHKVFDKNTDGLTLLFSFTTTAQQTVAKVIGETLFARRSETITLPSLNREDAAQFITDLIAAWSIDPERAPFPFTPESIEAVVRHLPSDDGLIPRDLIRAFDVVLRAADLDIDDGEIMEVGADYALARLADEGGV